MSTTHEENGSVLGFPPSALEAVEPIQMFDDFFYIGNSMVGTFVLKTSEGLVLIDAMESLDIDERIIIPSLKKLGFENEKILALLITHGHFDHYMGAPRIWERTGCQVGLSLEDTAFMSWSRENIAPGRPTELPRITLLLEDGKEYVFGDHKIYTMLAPGHTPGCLNFTIEVHEGTETHRVAIMGGYGVFGPDNYLDECGPYPYGIQAAVDNAFIFASTCVKFWEHCKATGCDVYLNPHPHLCDLFQNAEKNKARQSGEPNAFVIGTNGVRQWILERFQVCVDSAVRYTDITDEYTD